MEKLFSAKCCLLGFESYKPIGELYCDFNINEQKSIKISKLFRAFEKLGLK